MRLILVAALLSLALTAHTGAGRAAGGHRDPNLIKSESKTLAVRFQPEEGFEVLVAGVPLTRRSGIQLHAPDWSAGYYTSRPRPGPEHAKDARQLTAVHSAEPKIAFRATETARIVDDRTIELTVAGRLDAPVDARLEWNVGLVNAFALYGGGYATGAQGGDVVPVRPVAPRFEKSKVNPQVIQGADALRLQTRVGTILVRVPEGPGKLALIDGRLAPERWWAGDGAPALWLGVLGLPVRAGESFEFRVTFEFAPTPAATQPARVEPVTVAVAVTKTAEAYVPQSRPVQVIPKPKRIEWARAATQSGGPARFDLGATTRVVLGTPDAEPAARVLQREAHDRFAWTWKSAFQSGCKQCGAGAITFVDAEPGAVKPEGYRLSVTPDGVKVEAADPRGHFYAAQTLVQLVESVGDKAFVRAVSVEDWPSLAFRGIHIFPGKDAVDTLHRRLIERVMARHKINHVVIECSYTQWDTDRQIWVDTSVPKEQLEQYVRIARDNLIEPIPLVQSLGHAEWMFKNGANRDLAEDPEQPYAYSVTNPKTYDFILGVYAEAAEIFKGSKYFHIGHDEVTMRGRYPFRESSKHLSVTELFKLDVDRLHEFFRPRDVGLMLWGDMLLDKSESNDAAAFAPGAEEARRRRELLPKGSVVCDWHYTPTSPENYKSLKVFRDAGLRAIACPWFNPTNIYTIADAARRYGAWGLLQTTWAGYSITEQTVAQDAKQFTAYLLAAEYAWSADSPHPEELPWRPDEVFNRLMHPGREPTTAQPGFTLDLTEAANVELGGDGDAWLGYGASADLSDLAGGGRLGGLAIAGDRTSAVVLRSPLLPRAAPKSVTLDLAEPTTARQLAFCQTTGFPAPTGAQVGRVDVVYADGTRQSVPLVYGKNTRAWTDVDATPDATLLWDARTPDGLKVGVRLARWDNPQPTNPIRQLVFTTDHPYAAPVLIGVTGIE